MEAAVGFKVECKVGIGKVIAYIDGGRRFLDGRFLVQVKKNGRHDNELTSMDRVDVIHCPAGKCEIFGVLLLHVFSLSFSDLKLFTRSPRH
jgi:hypothetical protein